MIRFQVTGMSAQQIGIGFGLANGGQVIDCGFFGYLGASQTTWSYDPSTGDIVNATKSITGGLPRFKDPDTGTIALHVSMPRDQPGCVTFEIDGQILNHASVIIPRDSVVIPACCLLRPNQQVSIVDFTANVTVDTTDNPVIPWWNDDVE